MILFKSLNTGVHPSGVFSSSGRDNHHLYIGCKRRASPKKISKTPFLCGLERCKANTKKYGHVINMDQKSYTNKFIAQIQDKVKECAFNWIFA